MEGDYASNQQFNIKMLPYILLYKKCIYNINMSDRRLQTTISHWSGLKISNSVPVSQR